MATPSSTSRSAPVVSNTTSAGPFPALRALAPLAVRSLGAPRPRPARHADGHVVGLALVAAAALFGADLAAPAELSLAMAYLVPVVALAWSGRPGLVTLVVAAAVLAPVLVALQLPHAAWLLTGLALVGRAIGLGAAALVAAGASRWRTRMLTLLERDPLTSVLNRAGLARAGASLLGRARRARAPLAVAYLDVDDFKRINDERGHAEGDRVLATIGAVLASGRTCDLAARVGGDEFVLLLPATDELAAAAALDRVRVRTGAALAAAGLDATFTAGLVTFAEAPASVDAVLAAADRELRRGKRRGKADVYTASVGRAHSTVRLRRRGELALLRAITGERPALR